MNWHTLTDSRRLPAKAGVYVTAINFLERLARLRGGSVTVHDLRKLIGHQPMADKLRGLLQ